MQARFWLLVVAPIVTVATVLFITLDAGQTQDTTKVSLEERASIAPVQQVRGDASSQPNGSSLRVAIAGVLSPTRTLEYYKELLAYMEQKLGRQVTLVLKPTYAEINDLIAGQRVDVAFICSLAYVKGKDSFRLELLVAPQMYGETVYYSYLIVPRESSAASLRDLRGVSFAFTDPLSNSGHLAPAYQLHLLGETPVSFFSRYIFTYSHDNSITAVVDRLLDGAAVDSLVYEQLAASNPRVTARTKVIARWGPYGIPPVVVSPALEPLLKQQLRDFFLNLHQSEEGKTVLRNLAIDKFVALPDSAYDSIREMKTRLGW